ncbi:MULTISPECIES: hypothetical protein [Halomicrobium]|uniref:Uncharacterized protein n=1 Tax=Halomicrobium mukohataei TaxID=57705 RepID=A0A4D6KAI8_9EURY|nr:MULTISPECIES: hypothetical protein [Halomicrobium]QCD65458.1 hypothetical protein E5139_07325 [Halomicrobium mukohataei]QFR20264.1 hypothetical protein GBQ70_07320 [Halomicrobium sp. ZPS1]
MGVNIDYCEAIPDVVGGGEFCSTMQDTVSLGRKECAYGRTPQIYSVSGDLSLDSGFVKFDVGFYVGMGVDESGDICAYIGSEDTSPPICVETCVGENSITRKDAEDLAWEFARELADRYDITLGDIVVAVLAAVVAVVVIAALAAISVYLAGIGILATATGGAAFA